MATLTKLSRLHGFPVSGDIDTDGYVAATHAFQSVFFADGRPFDEKGYHKLEFHTTKIVGVANTAMTIGEPVTQTTSGARGFYLGCEDVKLTFNGNLTTDDTVPFQLGEKVTQANTGAIGYVVYCGMTNDGTNTTGFINVTSIGRDASSGEITAFDATPIVGATSSAAVDITGQSAIKIGKFHFFYRTTTAEFDEDNVITGDFNGYTVTPKTADDEDENLQAADYTGVADVDDGSCVQYLYLDGTADSGTFTITYEGTESGDIDFDSTWAEVSTILDTAFGAGIIVAEGQSGTDITDVSASNALILSFKSTQGSVNEITATTTSLLDGAVVLNATIATMTSGFTTVTAPPHWRTWKPVATFDTTADPGIMPDGGSNISTLCFGRIFLNSMTSPHLWFCTRRDDPLDFDSSKKDVAASTNSQNQEKAGLVGSPIIAMLSHKDQYLIMGCENDVYIMRSDPLYGGINANISKGTGFFSPTSWCWDDQNNLYFMGVDGIYKISTATITSSGTPVNLTKARNPKLISSLGLNRRTDRVAMGFDKTRYGIEISVTQKDGVARAVFWLDLRTGGLFPDKFPTDQSPASMLFLDSRKASERKLLLGCYDGYINTFDETTKNDRGENAIDSFFTVGPFVDDTSPRNKVTTNETSVTLGEDSDGLTASIYRADSADELVKAIKAGNTPAVTKTLTGDGLKSSMRTKITARAIAMKYQNSTADESYSIESINTDIDQAGQEK